MASESNSEGSKRQMWGQALEKARLGVWDWDLSTGTCFYSDTWYRMLGYEPGELPRRGDLWLQLIHPEDRAYAIASGDRHISGEAEGIETELRLRHKDGRWIWVLDRGGIVERDAEGRPTRIVGVQTDITKQKAAEKELAELNERFRLALAASQTGIWQYDFGTQKSHWDERTREIFGLEPKSGEIASETWQSFLHPEDRQEAQQKHSDPFLLSGGRMEMRYRIVRTDGSIRHVETLAQISDQPMRHESVVGTVRDVTAEVLAAEALSMERERLRITLEAISDAVISTDAHDRITFVNPAAATLLQQAEELLTGRSRSAVFAEIDGLSSLSPDRAHLPFELLKLNGTTSVLKAKTRPIRCTAGGVRGYVYTLQDVSKEYAREQELAYAAGHDALTGLLNRTAFDAQLEQRVHGASEDPFAVLYIDLDHFKALNDSAGHAAGDLALVKVADAMRCSLPNDAVIGRLGGDEFAAFCPATQIAQAEQWSDTILRAVRNIDLEQSGRHHRLGASIGIVFVAENGLAPADVLAHADDTCYVAKTNGRNRSAVFSDEHHRLSSRLTSARVVGDMFDAMDEDRLKLFGQEIRELSHSDEDTARVEILARLLDRSGQLKPPAEFIPAAERFGRAASLDRWIIKAALQRYGSTIRGGKLTLGFNLSAQTLSDPELWRYIETTVYDTGASFKRLVFEITETAAITNFAVAQRFVTQARAAGCRISLDDFGAGLSSFEYLRRFPIDSLKINGSFIENLVTSEFDRQIVASITRIADGLGYDVVAEKIENDETLKVLRQMKVKFGQGYHIHRPEPLDAVVRRLENRPIVQKLIG